jgi:tRNA A-37 threonylcarbamoyl transferase component Bud32
VLDNKCVEAEFNLHKQILDFSRHVAGSARITAVSLFDYCSTEVTRSKGAMEAVLVIRDFPARIMSYVKTIAGRTIVLLAVDQWIFERDIERGFLGEASAGTLVFPYVALSGERYLHAQEIRLKKRLIFELLESLALSFPELSDHIHIKPKYFMYEVLLNRVRVFPPLAQCVSNFTRSAERGKKPNRTLEGYMEALIQLEKETKVKFSDNYIMIPKKFISEMKKPRVWLTNISRNAQRTLFTPIFEVFPQLLNIFNQSAETLPKLKMLNHWKRGFVADQYFVDPRNYVFVPTANGLVSLANRLDIEAFVKDKLLNGEDGKIKLEGIGGVLNDVYLIKVELRGEEKRVVVKQFKDWSGFKWFPLNLWSLGTKKFAVLGKSRLEKECTISELLREEGFNVPKVLHVNHIERLVFMEFVEGETINHAIKRIAETKNGYTANKDLEKLSNFGETLAKVHALDVALGDTKPENVIVEADGKIYLVDFEQASKGGDKSWDIAEFLFYSGHYLPTRHSNFKAESIANAFLNGYLRAGGNIDVVKKAGASKYTRIFSLFTMPSVILAMSKACKRLEATS